MRSQSRSVAENATERIPLAQIKINFSRFVRDVQSHRRAITITQHGRDAAILAPVAVASRPAITIRGPVDPRPLGALKLRPPPRRGVSAAAIRRALDEERGE